MIFLFQEFSEMASGFLFYLSFICGKQEGLSGVFYLGELIDKERKLVLSESAVGDLRILGSFYF